MFPPACRLFDTWFYAKMETSKGKEEEVLLRRILLMALVLALLMGLAPAYAESYTFPAVSASVSLPEGVYQTVLTPDNLKANEAFIASQNGTVEDWAADFASRGVLLQAYDQKESRVLIITALNDVDAQRYYDINEQGADVRARYRASHGADGAYTVLGYKYDSISWKNFKGVGRFLQLRYSHRQEGQLVSRGFQRRTIRNGYTFTIDMRVYGRALKGGDNTALNKVFDTFAFTNVQSVPDLPVSIEESATAPVETNQPNFTLKGKTRPEAQLKALLVSFATSATQTFEATANKQGAYSLPITLPGEDVYLMTLTVSVPGLEDFSKVYNIRYQQGLLPVQIANAPPFETQEDSFVLSGSTDQSGVSARLFVNNQEQSRNIGKNGAFSFTIDTTQPGPYDIRLTFSKKGLQDRSFQYTMNRVTSQEAQQAALREGALTPTYEDLVNQQEGLDGKMLSLTGYIVSRETATGETIMKLALVKTDQGFQDQVVLHLETDPGFAIGTKVRVYGQAAGINIGKTALGAEERLPKLQVNLMEGEGH